MKNEDQCWHFIMSALVRIYGIEKVKSEESFHIFALEWCDEHDYKCDVHLDSLISLDKYIKKEYEEWN